MTIKGRGKIVIGDPLSANDFIVDILDVLRRPIGDGIFADSIEQRYARAVALVGAYDRAAASEARKIRQAA